MKKLNYFLVFAVLMALSCAAPKMTILLQESIGSPKVIMRSYSKYDEDGNKTTDSLSFYKIELKPSEYFDEYDIDWLKFHPRGDVFLVQVSGKSSGKYSRAISCVQTDDFRERWRLTLHQKGKISVNDVVFIDNKSVIFLNSQSEIVSLSLKNGEELWRIEKPQTINIYYFTDTNKLLVRNFGNILTLLNTDTGDSIWTTTFGSAYPGEPVRVNNELLIISDGISQYDLDDGLRWSNEFDTHYSISHAAASIAASVMLTLISGGAYVGNTYTPPDYYYGCFTLPQVFEDTIFLAAKGQVYTIDKKTGNILWQTDTIEDLDVINKIAIHGDNIYASCGGYTLFLKGKNNKYYFKTKGDRGIIALNYKTKETMWFINKFNETDDEAAIVREFFVKQEKIIVATEYEVIVLDKETGELLSRIGAEELRIGNILSSKEIEQGYLIKGAQGLSLLDKDNLEPLWSRVIVSFNPKSQFGFIPAEKISVAFWKKRTLTDYYSKMFYGSFFEFDSLNNLVYLVTEKSALVGLNIADGSIKFEIPFENDKFYFDSDKGIFININGYSVEMLNLGHIFQSL